MTPLHRPSRASASLAIGLGMALAAELLFAASAVATPDGAADGMQFAQEVGGDNGPHAAVAGQRLVVRAAPKGRSPVVAHVESGTELVVLETQDQWAKVEDFQTGRVLGWVSRSLLLNPSE